mmetsp:Transcript_28103/g.59095  ORF Transcript_28103/g.59095 Transcript_28103/m.59095 type:complete len:80 (+) Transcript_28103:450-689(+)
MAGSSVMGDSVIRLFFIGREDLGGGIGSAIGAGAGTLLDEEDSNDSDAFVEDAPEDTPPRDEDAVEDMSLGTSRRWGEA